MSGHVLALISRFGGAMLFALIAAPMPTLCAGEMTRTQRIRVTAPITVDADGKAVVGELGGVAGTVARLVHSQLSIARYLPAQRDGHAVSSKSDLSAAVVLAPTDDDRYTLAVESIVVGQPVLRRATPPNYPPEMARREQSGFVELRLRVLSNGRIGAVHTISATNAAFEKAALQATKTWKFQQLPTDGAAAEIEVSAPFAFLARYGDSPTFQCAVDPVMPRWEKQRGCLDLIEISLRR